MRNLADAEAPAIQSRDPETTFAISPDSDGRFINRELSWLAFNRRVLEEAQNPRHPLLERLRFVSISASNLDEFYMVRVAGLKGMVTAEIASPSEDGLTPAQQIVRVDQMAADLIGDQQKMWAALRVEMRDAGIAVLEPEELTDSDRAWLDTEFAEEIYPVLTPLALDPAHPFPFIPNLGFTLALQLTRKRDSKNINALLPIPPQLRRFVRLPSEGKDARFVTLEKVIGLYLHRLFPGYTVAGFRPVPSSSATAMWKSRKRPKIWCGCSRHCSKGAGADR